MRQIKFRAWDGKRNIMHQPAWEFYKQDSGAVIQKIFPVGSFDFTEMMQFTGRHDKNGKEIYEGDIIKRRGIKNSYIKYDVCKWVVEWNENGGIFCQDLAQLNKNHIEVIGNIYENPELLTA